MRGLLASAFRDLGIRVNTITPGLFPSQLTTDANGELYSVMKEQEKNIPKG
jgi:NAD(P)-dependent dehydrogenase (short-subunit alcohol dehydrogenase family)